MTLHKYSLSGWTGSYPQQLVADDQGEWVRVADLHEHVQQRIAALEGPWPEGPPYDTYPNVRWELEDLARSLLSEDAEDPGGAVTPSAGGIGSSAARANPGDTTPTSHTSVGAGQWTAGTTSSARGATS